MLFNSIDFFVFFPIIFILYWFILNKNIKAQNLLLLGASYFFYGWWDYRFLGLILFSSLVDYFIGQNLNLSNKKSVRRILLSISIFVNIGILFYFKYCNFFIENFVQTFTFLGNEFDVKRLNIILPVGISFYTFQTLSYSIDIYRRKLEPSNDLISFLAFVSFFPQLVAGPIERATNLLPQFQRIRTFDYNVAVDGCRQILLGFFKKVVIADGCAIFVNNIFENYDQHSGSTLLLAGTLFAFQIYGDFSGYSDIAIGISRLLGFNLMKNFNFPYFSRDIAEFWRRWHISLSTWFRDYIYIPMGGSQVSFLKKIRNIFAIFLISGFWHGANWTFVFWGGVNALYFMPLLLLGLNRVNTNQICVGTFRSNFIELINIIFTFFITIIAWIFFRSTTLSNACDYISIIFSPSTFLPVNIISSKTLISIFFIFVLITIEWIHRNENHGLDFGSSSLPLTLRWTIYVLLIITIAYFGEVSQDFIYFQF